MKRLSLLLLIAVAALVAACEGSITITRPSGTIIDETVEVGSFTGINLTAVGSVNVTQGESTSVVVSADDNIMPLLQTEVEDDMLVLSIEGNNTFSSPPSIIYEITVPQLDSIRLSGAGNINTDRIEGESFSIRLSGAGDMVIPYLDVNSLDIALSGAGSITISEGRADQQRIESSGVGSYAARGLQSTEAEVSLSGAGNITLSVSETLNGEVSGVGNIAYVGNPTVDVNVSGIGSVNRVGSS